MGTEYPNELRQKKREEETKNTTNRKQKEGQF